MWDAHDDRKINGYVTATSLTDLFYILRKRTNQQQAWESVQKVFRSFTICEVNETILEYALQLSGSDFEDNVQIACAYAYELGGIVTRDETGFVRSKIPVFKPGELLAELARRTTNDT
ncbi:MAG: PIN domain-containing protein [Anaerolineales bacterium]|nr:PIN domain-containing protein [Anaerolineales bacterium]